ncbi:MAG TPA: TonB-dependent receptor [Steroidobacteraceae bacterium]|nr:TonB-dependent receptor [Steroidobacteraceae bacterium]
MLCLLTASLVMAPHAFAQQATTTQPPAAASTDTNPPLEEVTVTGSRIKRTTDFTTATPTTVIDTTTMENVGVVNVGDVLAMIPANVSNFTPATTANGSFNTGAYIADLRGLNPFFGSRPLTLIDSQRAVSTNTLDSFDLNFIPQVLVQRIDSVTGGASAAYGSGAVSGAINIILDHQLEGGKFDADTYDTHYNDAKSDHVAAAYGHGLFDNRVHFVIGAEYQKQDPASCQLSGRTWCSANFGPYQTSTIAASGYGTANTAIFSTAGGLTTNVNPYGVFAPAGFNPATFSYGSSYGQLYSGTSTGLGDVAFDGTHDQYSGTAPGGAGTLVNQYTNLVTSVKRGIVTGLISAKITDSINMNLDLNWGKVDAFNPLSNFQIQNGTLLGFDNPYLQAVTGENAATLAANAQTAVAGSTIFGGPGDSPGYFLSKDFNSQIPDVQFQNTTLKQVSLSFDGKFGDTSWTWDGHGLYGKTAQVEGSYHEPSVLEYSMALDAVNSPNGPTCRVSGGLAPGAATLGAGYTPSGSPFVGGVGTFFGLTGGLPVWAQVYNSVNRPGGFNPTNPVSGLTENATLALMASRCQPLNPFGNAALPLSSSSYATGPLSLSLVQTMTSFTLNSSGEIFKGIGAGAFSLAAGYEWHREITDNDFASCPGARNTLSNSGLTTAESDCLAVATDFSYQFGNDYGGSSTYNEVYAEFNFPLLKNVFLAKTLQLDLTGRESRYDNVADYGVDVVPGAEGKGNLPTWKASLVWEPIDGIRFRGAQSHDSRAPDPRDLYYSQSFVPGSVFGSCFSSDFSQHSLCTINLLGNVALKPETANTTTLGVVFSPPPIPGLQASADWFHIHLKDGIEGGNAFADGANCSLGETVYCNQMTFNPLFYSPTAPAPGQPRASSTTNPGGWLTGAPAFQLGDVANVVGENGAAYNGGAFDERGVDFSVSYLVALPGASTLNFRALTTWTGEQVVQDSPGGVTYNILNATGGGGLFLPNYQPAARWRGNLYVTWNVGNFSLTPNMSWVGQGTVSNNDLSCSAGDFANKASLCNWLANGFYAGPTQTAAQKLASGVGYSLLPQGYPNHVASYFLFGLNAAYTLDKIPGLKGLQLWGQVSNVFNKAPPFVDATTPGASAAFYDQLGQAYRVGFRMTF